MPAFIHTHDLSYTLADGSPLLNDIRMHLHPGRYGLTGANGSGKSTLLQLLAGRLSASSGQIQRSGRCCYLPQHSGQPIAELTGIAQPLQALARIEAGNGDEADFSLGADDWSLPERCRQAVLNIGLDAPVPTTAAGWLQWLSTVPPQLSGGQRQRLQLALAFALQPDILLLDEPGNDLDASARDWLSRNIAMVRGLVVVVSHQPQLLRSVQTMLWLHDGNLTSVGGDYDDFIHWQQQEQAAACQQLQDNRKRLQQVQRQTQENREKAQRRAQTGRRQRRDGSQGKMLLDMKTNRAEQRRGAQEHAQQQRLTEAREQLQASRLRAAATDPIHWPFPDGALRSGWLVQASAVQLPRGDAQPLSFCIRQGEHWHLRGRNGAGKSTLLQLLSGELQPKAGELVVRSPVVRLAQQGLQLSDSEQSLTAVTYLHQTCPGHDCTTVRGWLAAVGVDADHCQRPLAQLSGGQRMKVALLALSWQQAGALLLLDEPDNHLDADSRRELQQALQQWPGSWILVSHDADFVASCGTQLELQLSA